MFLSGAADYSAGTDQAQRTLFYLGKGLVGIEKGLGGDRIDMLLKVVNITGTGLISVNWKGKQRYLMG